MRGRARLLAAAVLGAWALAGVTAAASWAAPAAPYVPPPFADRCTVQHFGEGETPDVSADWPDPLCVEYEKRDITVSNGGAIDFLAAEPSRFAIAGDRCQYWQQDHWSVQLAPGSTAVVRWDGSYWFDKGAGTGAALLDGFQIGEQPVGAAEAADAVEPISPELADQIRAYGSNPQGGGGMSFTLPGGMPGCPTDDGAAPGGGDENRGGDQGDQGDEGGGSDQGGDGNHDAQTLAAAAGGSLPATGAGAATTLGGALALAAAAALGRRQP